jgi:riboflavin synthase
MFTGIIEELGIVKSLKKKGASAVLSVAAKVVAADAVIGDSICVNGACLTVVKNYDNVLHTAKQKK